MKSTGQRNAFCRWAWWVVLVAGVAVVMVMLVPMAAGPPRVAVEERGAVPPPEQRFAVFSPSSWHVALAGPMERLQDGWSAISRWEKNPWREKRRHWFGSETRRLAESKDAADQERFAELQKLAKEWMERLLVRYPELTVEHRGVPPERNALRQLHDLMGRFPPSLNTLRYGASWRLSEGMDAGSDPTLREWVASNAGLLEELRAIGIMPDRSMEGLDAESQQFLMMCVRLPDILFLDADVAMADKDYSRALSSLMAAKGIAGHLLGAEAPDIHQANTGFMLEGTLRRYVLDVVMEQLPPGEFESGGWEKLARPAMRDATDFSRLVLGSYHYNSSEYLLPTLSNPAEARLPYDADELVETYTRLAAGVVRDNTGKPPGTPAILPDDTAADGLSRMSRDLLSRGRQSIVVEWLLSQEAGELQNAAVDVAMGKPAPVDPASGLPYKWDPVTRELAYPNGPKHPASRPSVQVPVLKR